ncbi:hypothetical protein SCUCBS95973_007635 [Sporothrix curviconia]|uniref:Uncharacterized protein n=1 Tax=Sporothrix curviconia TaxID=1260050 RepID=A0ABP0CHQ2_9PEZI
MASQQAGHAASPRHEGTSTTSLLAALFTGFLLTPAVVHADNDITPGVEIPKDHGPALSPVLDASFTTNFTNVVQGQTLALAWSAIDPKYEPLSITARAINRTSDGRGNSFLVTIAPQLYNTSSYSWATIPYPLSFLTTGLYELEIRPAIWNLSANEPGTLTVPVLARSPFFKIASENGDNDTGHNNNNNNEDASSANTKGSGSTQYGQSMSGAGSTTSSSTLVSPRHLALALGLSLSLTAVLALVAAACFARRRQQRKLAEAERQKEKQLPEMLE